jgi:salicylate hydroxylase
MARMHRASLQKALLKKLPAEILRLGKRVIGIDVSNGENVVVHCGDSTSITADVVIGADGIKFISLHFKITPRSKIKSL